MKKIKLLSFLLAAPLLVSCGIAKPKQPKFADPGKKIDFAKFNSEVSSASAKSDFYSTKAIDGGIFKVDSRSIQKDEHIRDKKTLGKGVDAYQEVAELKYDKANKIIQSHAEINEKYNLDFKSFVRNEEWHEAQTYSFQEGKVDGKSYVIKANKEYKEFEKASDLTSEYKVENYLDESIKDFGIEQGTTIEYALYEYSSLDAKAQKKWSFYQNGKVFTIEGVLEVVNDDVEYKSVEKTTFKIQVDFTSGNNKSLSYYESVVETTYKVDTEVTNVIVKKGDVMKHTGTSSTEASYVFKDIKLKAFDVSKFTKMGANW